ncbi:DsbA family protein [Methylopila musalis]|uniref:DsbA family protein n=1 Tax=Methylopila musalis TaxID=1134781 RepID=A0ABW3Z9P7_9HYPH
MTITRREALVRGAGALAVGAVLPGAAAADDLSRDMIVGDPAAPVGGNPRGDVTLVAFLDYNCPYCKTSAPALKRAVRADGRTRLVYKDWPILGRTSVYGAKLALAAHRQGRYEAAHEALMALKGASRPVTDLDEAVAAAGVDMARLKADAARDDAAIVALLKRNDAQAKGMGFPGTPIYLVGPLLVAEAPDEERFRAAIAKARERQKG